MLRKKDRSILKRDVTIPMLFLGMAFALHAAPARAQEPYAIESATVEASAYIPQSIVAALNPNGTRLFTHVNGLKMPISEIFWAKNVVTIDKPSSSGKILYGSLKPGALVGVIRFLAEADEDYREDFHDQKLRPGYYTMRYAQMPDEEKQSDKLPRDFVVLSPVSVDRDPNQALSFEELSRMSRIASRGKQPAVMSLVSADAAPASLPGVRTDDAGTCILQVKLNTKPEKGGSPQDLALAIIVVTPIQENGAS